MDPTKVKTEVFFLPCAVSIEKEGSITNSGRWMQWRYKGPDSPNGQKPDGDLIYELMKEIQELYKKEGGAYPRADHPAHLGRHRHRRRLRRPQDRPADQRPLHPRHRDQGQDVQEG